MKKSGFTLAEVLLTLAIIGVVAAMTVPSLMNSTEDKKLGAATKKAYNTLQNAITMRQALTEMTPEDSSSTSSILKELIGEGADKVQTLKYNEKNGDGTIVQTPDGIIFGLKSTAAACTKTTPCVIVADVNGEGGPKFSGVVDGTSASGAEIKALSTTSLSAVSAESSSRAQRDIVFFKVAGMDVTPDTSDYNTNKYISGKKPKASS